MVGPGGRKIGFKKFVAVGLKEAREARGRCREKARPGLIR